MRCGMPVTFSESLLKLPQDIRKVRPTILLAPPRMWERIYSTICTELRKRPAAARKAFYGALGLGLAAARYRREGKPVPARIRAAAGAGRPLCLPQSPRAASAGAFKRRRLRRGAAEQGSGRVLRSHRHAADRRLRADRRRRGRRSIRSTVRSPAASASRWPASRSRFSDDGETAGQESLPLFRLPERSGDHRRGAARRLAAHRRHRALSIAKATSSSPAARRS